MPYASPFQGWAPVSRDAWEIEPGGAYQQFLEALTGYGERYGQYGKWLQGAYPEEYQRYLGFSATSPQLKWTDYLDTIGPDMKSMYKSTVPLAQRGGQERNQYRWW